MSMEPEVKGKMLITTIFILTIMMEVLTFIIHSDMLLILVVIVLSIVFFRFIILGRVWAKWVMALSLCIAGLYGVITFVRIHLSGKNYVILDYLELQLAIVFIIGALILTLSPSVKAYLVGYKNFHAQSGKK